MNVQRYTCARLTTGQIVPLRKDCECRREIHSGPHWLHASESWRKANVAALGEPAQASALALIGFASEESARLRQLQRDMQRAQIVLLLTDEDVAALRASGEAVDLSRPGLRPQIKRLMGCSLAQVEAQIGRWGRTYDGFFAVWEWCAVRLGGATGFKHERFVAQHGFPAYYRRINRMRKACGFEPLAVRSLST